MGEELLHALVQSVSAVQLKYGYHSGLAIEEDYCVSNMCRHLETVLLHRAKFRKAAFLKDTDDDILVWDLVCRFLSKSEIVRFENETSLKSGIGRLRSWLRSILNDGLIEKYLQQIVDSDNSLLRLYYEGGSMMLDKSIVSSLPHILSGVSTVLFSFDLDRSSFNTPIRIDRTMSATIATKTQHKPHLIVGNSKGKRKLKRPEISDIVDSDIPIFNIVEPVVHTPPPCIEGLLGEPSSLFSGEDVELENLLLGLIPQLTTSGSSDEDSQVKRSSSSPDLPLPTCPTNESKYLQVGQAAGQAALLSVGDILEQSFEVGTLPDTLVGGEVKPFKRHGGDTESDGQHTTHLLPDITPLSEVEEWEEEGEEGSGDTVSVRQLMGVVVEGDGPTGGEEEATRDLVDKVELTMEEFPEVNVVTTGTEEEEELDPYEDDLPRSSAVICKPYPPAVKRVLSKPYPPAVKRVLSNKRDVPYDSVESDMTLSEKNKTLTRETSLTGETLPETLQQHDTTAVRVTPVTRSTIISRSVPTSVPPAFQQRSMSVQLPVRLPPLGSPVRTQFDIDEYSNCDAVSICSDISSVREYAGCRSIGDGVDHDSGSVSTISESLGFSYTAGELRDVLTTLLQQKEEIEVQNRQLQETLGREMVTRLSLKEEIEHMQNSFIQCQSHDQAVIRGLQRENQTLKQQLKKYVSVVQQLRRDDRIPPDHELASVLVEVPVIQPLQLPAAQTNISFCNSALEQKLAQVSEMHGELMELNQQLVTKNMAREKQLQNMEKKLSEIEAKEASRREKKSGKQNKREIDFSDFQLVESPLLQIWIPAAMIRGKGTTKYHVYQVIVQVQGEQWTVYRRYAEFRSFHKLVVQKHPYFSKLELPGRTHFNRKVPSVVEERRGKLEVYLQRVTSCLADRKQGLDNTDMDLHRAPCKATVTAAIHFLREQTRDDDLYSGF